MASFRPTPLPSEREQTIIGMIERVMSAVNAINVLNVFCSCYTVISAVS